LCRSYHFDIAEFGMASSSPLFSEMENTTSRVWVSQVKDVWEPAEVLNRTLITAELVISRTTKHSEGAPALKTAVRATVDLSKVSIVPRNPAHLEGRDDLVKLQFLDEPNIMHNLEIRYEAEKIYTSTGPILIAINPWKELSIYGRDYMEKYKDHVVRHEDERLPPHVYAVADSAYRDMLRTGARIVLTKCSAGSTGCGKGARGGGVHGGACAAGAARAVRRSRFPCWSCCERGDGLSEIQPIVDMAYRRSTPRDIRPIKAASCGGTH
jgi:hypothetical protein